MSDFIKYRRKQIAELRPCNPDADRELAINYAINHEIFSNKTVQAGHIKAALDRAGFKICEK